MSRLSSYFIWHIEPYTHKPKALIWAWIHFKYQIHACYYKHRTTQKTTSDCKNLKQNHDFAKFTLDADECLHNHVCSVLKILMTCSTSVLNCESEIQSFFMCWQRKTHWAGIFLSKLLATFLAKEMHSNWFSGHRRNWFPHNFGMIDY